jgi:hypothetical protein
VFVVDVAQTIHVTPDGSHAHPLVLGFAQPALYAGEIHIDHQASVAELTNLSGTFRFDRQSSLCCVVMNLRLIGFIVRRIAWYPPDGSSPPVCLACA